MACYTYSLVSVPLYDTLGTEAISYIVEKGKPQQQQHEYLHLIVFVGELRAT